MPTLFLNVLENSQVGMMFVVPRRKEVVRINGPAQVVLDDELLDLTTVNGHRPDMVLLVRVQEAFFHCGKSMIWSGMWQPEKWESIDGLPTYSQALKDHGEMETPLDEIEARMAHNDSDRLYWVKGRPDHHERSGVIVKSGVWGFGSYGDLAGVDGFNSVFERDAGDDFGEVVKAA
jgi:hypothetical protein